MIGARAAQPAPATCTRPFQGALPVHGQRDCRRVGRRIAVGQLRDAEIEDLDPAVPGDEQVLRLDVAVDDAALVRGGQAARDLDRRTRRPGRTATDGPASSARSVSPSSSSVTMKGELVVPADVVNREDIGMRETRDRQRFLFESL